MKSKFFFILSLTALVPYCIANSDKKKIGTIQPKISNEIDNSISILIGKSFLQGRMKILKANQSDYESDSLEKKIFGTVKLHNIEMWIKKEEYADAKYIIIETEVRGTPEDFKNINVLEYESVLLKHVLIQRYLKNVTEQAVSVPIDDQTKATMPPEFLIYSRQIGFNSYEEYSKDRMGMKFITIFSKEEFDILIKQYFIDPIPKKNESSKKWNLFGFW